MSRPRGYFGVGREQSSRRRQGAARASTTACPVPPAASLAFRCERANGVMAVFNNETIAARTWPVKDNHIVVAEFMN